MYNNANENSPEISEALVRYNTSTKRYSQLVAIIGGSKSMNKHISNEMDLINMTRAGLPKKSLDSLAKKLGVSMERMSALLHISHRTIQRKSPSDNLSVHVSEQILSIAEVIRKGIEVMGDQDKLEICLLYTSPSPRDATLSRMPSSA